MINYLVLLLLIGCSSVSVINTSNHPVTFTARPGHPEVVEKTFEKQFYLWGLYPENQIIDIGELLDQRGYKSGSSLVLTKQMTIGSLLWPVVSLGFIIPKTFKVKFRARY